MSAAQRMAALDASDPYPSIDEMARRAGCEPPVSAPGDRFTWHVQVALYWPLTGPEGE